MTQTEHVDELKRICHLTYKARDRARIKIWTTSGRVIVARDVTLAQKTAGGLYFKYAPLGFHRWQSLWLREVQRLEYSDS